ncbi:MAG: TIGR00341 family protein [Candidatus Bathyarchaeia archaeon]
MKKLEVSVTKGQSNEVEEVFKQMELSYIYSVIRIGGKKCGLYSALIPNQLIDKTIDALSEKIDLRLRENMISVIDVEGVVSTYLDRLKEKAAKENPPSNPLERLVERTEQYIHLSGNMLIMASFATLIALAGLFLDNVAIVIGAMLVSPLLGPINAFAVNASLGRIKRVARSQFYILVLLMSIIALSAFITFIASFVVPLPITTQIAARGIISPIDIAIALTLGFAGGLALFVAIPEILVGVAVAVALLPPVTVAGVGLALLNVNLFLGAITLTFVNLLGLELGGTLMLKMKGVSPRRYYQKAEAKRPSAYSILILAFFFIILGLVVLFMNH